MSPRPVLVHQLAATRLATRLSNACPDHLCVLAQPAMQVSEETEFDPDIVVMRLEDVRGAKLLTPPLLAVEVRSPSTAVVDRNAQLAAYQEFGVASYWIFDPSPDRPELTVFELQDGAYRQCAQASGGSLVRIERPFAVELVPARLTLS